MRGAGVFPICAILLSGCDPYTVVSMNNGLSTPAAIGLPWCSVSFGPGEERAVPPEFTVSVSGCDYAYDLRDRGIGPLGERVFLILNADMLIYRGQKMRLSRRKVAAQPPGWPIAPKSKTCG